MCRNNSITQSRNLFLIFRIRIKSFSDYALFFFPDPFTDLNELISIIPLRIVLLFHPNSFSARLCPPTPNSFTICAINCLLSLPFNFLAVSINKDFKFKVNLIKLRLMSNLYKRSDNSLTINMENNIVYPIGQAGHIGTITIVVALISEIIIWSV